MRAAPAIILNRWTPRQLGQSLAAWYEPRQGGMFQSNAGTTQATAASDVVGYVPDLSGKNFHLASVADDTTRPQLGSGPGRGAYLSFDGSNDIIRRAAALGGAGSFAAGTASWFIALRSNSNGLNTLVAAEGSSAGNNPIYSINGASTGAATMLTGFIRDDANASVLSNASAVQANVFDGTNKIVGVIDNGVSVTPWVEGLAGTAFTYTARGASTVTVDRFAIGGLVRASASSFWAGRIYAAVFVTRVLSTAEIRALSNYLARTQDRAL